MWPALPYELIGKATVALVVLALMVAAGIAVLIALHAVWYRGLTWVINRMWKGYDIHGEQPPYWKRRVSLIAYHLRQFDFSEYEHRKRELDKRERRDTDE